MFGAGTTLENQMQLSASTLTVSNIQRNMAAEKFIKTNDLEIFWMKSWQFGDLYVGRNMAGWKKALSKKEITLGKSKRSKPGTKSILSHSFRIWRKSDFLFSFLESNLFCCENSLWVPLKVQMSAMPGGGGGLIKCWRSSHWAQT